MAAAQQKMTCKALSKCVSKQHGTVGGGSVSSCINDLGCGGVEGSVSFSRCLSVSVTHLQSVDSEKGRKCPPSPYLAYSCSCAELCL